MKICKGNTQETRCSNRNKYKALVADEIMPDPSNPNTFGAIDQY